MPDAPNDDRDTTELAADARPTTGMAPGTDANAASDAHDAAPAAAEPPEEPTEPSADPPAGPPASKSRIVTYLVALLVLSVVGPVVFYLAFWRFEPTAQFHIPGGMTVAIRLDSRELYLFAPFRDHVLPLMNDASSDRTRPSKLDQLRSETGVDLGNDLREVIVATSDGQSWVLLAGGRFLGGARRGPYVEGYERAMEKEPAFGEWVQVGDVLSGPRGMGVTQAEDGTLIFASSVDMAKAAIPPTDDYRDLWLASSGALSFSIKRAALEHFASAQQGSMPEAALFDKLERVTGWITLGEKESRITMELAGAAGQPIDIVMAQTQALIAATGKLVEAQPDLETLKPLFTTVKIQERQSTVMVSATLKGKESEAAMKRLATWIGEARPLH